MNTEPTTVQPSRRSILKASAAAAGMAAYWGTGPVPAAAAKPLPRETPGQLVVVFLRGGQDHLSAVVPYTDPNYYRRRPTIAVPATEVLRLNNRFGFHPTMTGMHNLFEDGRLAVVVGAGNIAGDRSHFVAQDLWEFGSTDIPEDGNGWLGRYLADTAREGESLFRGVTSGNNVHLSLAGYPALGIASIANFGLGGFSGSLDGEEKLVRRMYRGQSTAQITGSTALDAAKKVQKLPGSETDDDVALAFADTVELLDAGIGVETVTLDIGHWDTHDAMGTWEKGEMRYLLDDLDTHIAAFQANLDQRGLDKVTTVVMTEFGRRVDENGNQGTDHGWGSAMYVLGGGVGGGKVYGSIPTLTEANTAPHRHDVPVATDCRDVLAEVASYTLAADPGAMFPGHTAAPVGIIG